MFLMLDAHHGVVYMIPCSVVSANTLKHKSSRNFGNNKRITHVRQLCDRGRW